MLLDALAAARTTVPAADPRLRVEHAQIVDLADIPRFAALGAVASMQPTHATSDMAWVPVRLGPDRLAGAYAWRRFLDAGVPLAFGSDFPVDLPDAAHGLAAAVSRQDAAGDPPGEWGFRCVDPGEIVSPFVLVHEPAPAKAGYALEGHVHPAVRLTGGANESLRLPCFWFDPRVGVLPSFGAFTGSAVIRPGAGDRVFVVADDEVIRV